MTETPSQPNQQPQPQPVDYASQTVETNKDARTWGMLCHLLALSGFLTSAIGWIVGPLIMWLIKKNDFAFVDDQGKESLNFQIWMFIYALVSFILTFVCIGFILLPAVAIFDLVMVIIASMKANQGIRYRYPLVIYRFLK